MARLDLRKTSDTTRQVDVQPVAVACHEAAIFAFHVVCKTLGWRRSVRLILAACSRTSQSPLLAMPSSA